MHTDDLPARILADGRRLLAWLEDLDALIRPQAEVFADFDLGALSLGIVLFRHRVLPHAGSNLGWPLTVVICGGTNAGKSTLANTLVGAAVSPSGGTASYTKRIIGLASLPAIRQLTEAHAEFFVADFVELASEQPSKTAIFVDAEQSYPEDLPILLDTPDIDSSDPSCRSAALTALGLGDVVLWVTTQQKYKDEAGISYLNTAMQLHRCRLDVFNQALPRHAEALEDLLRYYGELWPENDRAIFRIDEQRDLVTDLLPEKVTASLRQRLCYLHANRRAVQAQAIRHALTHAGKALEHLTTQVFQRQSEWERLYSSTQQRCEKKVFQPLKALPGHELPLELQAAIIRVLSPHLRNPIGDAVNFVHNSITNAFSWTFKHLTQHVFEMPSAAVDPIQARDSKDLEDTAQLLEQISLELTARFRKRARAGDPLHKRCHTAVKALNLSEGPQLRTDLQVWHHEQSQVALVPLLQDFERHLSHFCENNPNIIKTMKYAIPGVSALTAFAAAILGVQTLAVLPGASEVLVSGIAVPIYKRVERNLVDTLLQLTDRMAQEPFIQKARNEYSAKRRQIFVSMGERFIHPILSALVPPRITFMDVGSVLERLHQNWTDSFADLLCPLSGDIDD